MISPSRFVTHVSYPRFCTLRGITPASPMRSLFSILSSYLATTSLAALKSTKACATISHSPSATHAHFWRSFHCVAFCLWLLSDDAVFLGGWSHSHQLLCLRLLALVGSCAWGHDFGDISEGELLGVIVYLRMI